MGCSNCTNETQVYHFDVAQHNEDSEQYKIRSLLDLFKNAGVSLEKASKIDITTENELKSSLYNLRLRV